MRFRERAEKKLAKDLDVVYLINTIYKLKASVKVLVSHRHDLLAKIAWQYHNDKLLEMGSDSSLFSEFLEGDELFHLKQ
jgi:hypothetical protein